ncbi:hypothetical protein [Oceaniglobus trochenteri]|uniref:hypothetical protein n=1 Tax=Oceaniglobus trochenteri TaxID=2763260 RepID=UPI001CFF85A3|nr:hypothetical protein [Oceaniglobus trochenteri]
MIVLVATAYLITALAVGLAISGVIWVIFGAWFWLPVVVSATVAVTISVLIAGFQR